MKPSIVLSIAGCLVGLAGLAHAGQTISSATIYGAFNQDTAECIVRNVGKSPISVEVNIIDESGNPLATGGNCAAAVQPGDYCFKRAPISFGVAYACSATPTGSAEICAPTSC